MKVDWPLAQILEDAKSTGSECTDFEVMQAAYNCVFYLPLGEQLEYL